MKRLPLPTVLMGIVSPIPAIVFAVGGLFSSDAVPGMTMGLVEYAALVLAFSGAVHWGLALDRPMVIMGTRLDAGPDNRRLLMGALPLPVGWWPAMQLFWAMSRSGWLCCWRDFSGCSWQSGRRGAGENCLRAIWPCGCGLPPSSWPAWGWRCWSVCPDSLSALRTRTRRPRAVPAGLLRRSWSGGRSRPGARSGASSR